jgi:hypothetical protein
MAVERALAEELGVHCRLLYKWRDQLEATRTDRQASATLFLANQLVASSIHHPIYIGVDREYSVSSIRNAVLWIAGNLPSDGKVPEREKTLDVAKQVSQRNVRRELCRLMVGRHLCSRPDACPF